LQSNSRQREIFSNCLFLFEGFFIPTRLRNVAQLIQFMSILFQKISVPKSSDVRLSSSAAAFALSLLIFAAPAVAWADAAVFHLKNGDRISGRIVSEMTNTVVIETRWNKELAIPLSEIERREENTNSSLKVVTGTVAATIPPGPIAVAAAVPKSKKWKAEAKVGADFLSGAKNQQIYYGRFKWTYVQPYHSNPKQHFQNVFDYSADYGWTETPGEESVVSANRMFSSDKTGFDIDGSKWFTYGLGSGGYDEVRKIDLQYEAGAGMGYHLLAGPKLLFNIESGLDYQVQYRSDETTTKNFFFRVGHDATWKINSALTWAHKIEFFPRTDSPDFRSRAESTLSYALWRNLSLNLSVLDFYDTQPAQKVPNNDLQVHTSVGFSF
jgi:hypothetical protein